METLRRFLGLDKEGRGVSPATSLLYSMALSVLISFVLRLLAPGLPYPLRLILFFVIAFSAFRWIDNNHRRNKN